VNNWVEGKGMGMKVVNDDYIDYLLIGVHKKIFIFIYKVKVCKGQGFHE
jgi:hypothetical protein